MQQELDESQGSPDRRRALQAGCAMEESQGSAVEYRWKEDCFPWAWALGWRWDFYISSWESISVTSWERQSPGPHRGDRLTILIQGNTELRANFGRLQTNSSSLREGAQFNEYSWTIQAVLDRPPVLGWPLLAASVHWLISNWLL